MKKWGIVAIAAQVFGAAFSILGMVAGEKLKEDQDQHIREIVREEQNKLPMSDD